MQVYVNDDPNKMGTIREQRDDEGGNDSDGSDTGYFEAEEESFNERDELDSDEEKKINERLEQFYSHPEDEDHQAYSDEEDNDDEEDTEFREYERQKEKEEFGEDEEEEEQEKDESTEMSMTMIDRRRQELEKEVRDLHQRFKRLEVLVRNKREEAVSIAGSANLFEEFMAMFKLTIRVRVALLIWVRMKKMI